MLPWSHRHNGDSCSVSAKSPLEDLAIEELRVLGNHYGVLKRGQNKSWLLLDGQRATKKGLIAAIGATRAGVQDSIAPPDHKVCERRGLGS